MNISSIGVFFVFQQILISETYMQTPILWLHGTDDGRVLFEAGQAGPPLLEKAGLSCEFKVRYTTGQ